MPDPGRTPSFPRLEPVEHTPAAPVPARPRGLRLKRALDRVGAAVALVLALPVLVVAAVVAKLSSAESVLVRERRIARDGTSFQMLAFAPVPVLRRFSADQRGWNPRRIARAQPVQKQPGQREENNKRKDDGQAAHYNGDRA